MERASDEEIVALLGACPSARDRLIVLVMARAGLGWDVTLACADIPSEPERGEPGRDLPASIMQQICVACDGRRGRSRLRLAGGRARCGARS